MKDHVLIKIRTGEVKEVVRLSAIYMHRQTLIVVTHDIHVGEIVDRLVTLEHGRVLHSKWNRLNPALLSEAEAATISVWSA